MGIFYQPHKKSSLRIEENAMYRFVSSSARINPIGIGTVRYCDGCRSFIGPVPQLLLMKYEVVADNSIMQ